MRHTDIRNAQKYFHASTERLRDSAKDVAEGKFIVSTAEKTRIAYCDRHTGHSDILAFYFVYDSR